MQLERVLELKAALAAVVDRHAAALTHFGSDVFAHPEIGYREERTATRIAEALARLGLPVEEGLALTGVRARLRGAKPGPTVCVMGELDGLPVPGHPSADPATGVAHACGHNAQLAHLLGVATALVETEAARDCAGEIVFLAVPAEEYVDLEWRAQLVRRGKVEFFGGKAEMLRTGVFDDVDLAMMVHASGTPNGSRLSVSWHCNGFVAKRARFIGRAAHAGNAPDRGVNALNAAMLAMQAMHAQRETFRDEDHVRVHPIVTHGGDAVNVVPADARVETFVRGASLEAIADAAEKVDRALRAGALGVGASVEIQTLPGYLPLSVDCELGAIFRRNAIELVGAEHWGESPLNAASTDAGDLSHVMPVLHPGHGGCAGANHTIDFRITDPADAYVTPAKAMAFTLVDLLADGAAGARHAIAAFRPKLTRDAYLAKMRAFNRTERFTA
jgi:amidohydrolase